MSAAPADDSRRPAVAAGAGSEKRNEPNYWRRRCFNRPIVLGFVRKPHTNPNRQRGNRRPSVPRWRSALGIGPDEPGFLTKPDHWTYPRFFQNETIDEANRRSGNRRPPMDSRRILGKTGRILKRGQQHTMDPLYRFTTCVQFCCSEIEQASWGSLGPRIPNSPVVFGSRRFRVSIGMPNLLFRRKSPVAKNPPNGNMRTASEPIASSVPAPVISLFSVPAPRLSFH